MKNIDTIINRVTELEKSLVWRIQDGQPTEHRLVSSDTGRIVTVVSQMASKCVIGGARNGHCDQEFDDLEKALLFAKFAAIRDILSEDLRRNTIQ